MTISAISVLSKSKSIKNDKDFDKLLWV